MRQMNIYTAEELKNNIRKQNLSWDRDIGIKYIDFRQNRSMSI